MNRIGLFRSRRIWVLALLLPFALGLRAAFDAPVASATTRLSAEATAAIESDGLTATDPGQATPSPTSSPTATLTPTASPTFKVTATARPTNSPTIAPTATFTPTLTMGQEFDSHFPASTGSKLGLHCVRGSPGSYKFLQTARPPLIKLVDAALAWSPNLRSEFPNMIQIGRVTGQEDGSLLHENPIIAATEYVSKTMHYYQQYPAVDYWEGWNEFTPEVWGSPQEWGWFAQFEAARACLMQYYGYHAIIGNFSTGRPEFNEMLLFVPALRIGLKCGAIFGLHEYSAPTLQYGYGSGIPGRPSYPDRGMLTFRYRYWYDDLLIPLHVPIPLAITEMGIDGGVGAGRPGPTGALGWRHFAQYWQQTGLGDDPAQAYVAQLAWYDSEMRKDPYVLGATIFNAGTYDNSPFEVETMLSDLTNYMVSVQGK